MLSPDPRHHRRFQAGPPLIALSEFGRPPLDALPALPPDLRRMPCLRSQPALLSAEDDARLAAPWPSGSTPSAPARSHGGPRTAPGPAPSSRRMAGAASASSVACYGSASFVARVSEPQAGTKASPMVPIERCRLHITGVDE